MKNKKILLELLLVPVCLGYLFHMLLSNNQKISYILLIVMLLLTTFTLILKYGNEVYVYESKYNIYKIILIIFSVILFLISLLSIFLMGKFVRLFLIITTIILLLYLFYCAVRGIINIIKNGNYLYRYIIRVFFSSISFALILEALIFYLK